MQTGILSRTGYESKQTKLKKNAIYWDKDNIELFDKNI